jgi:putative transposase
MACQKEMGSRPTMLMWSRSTARAECLDVHWFATLIEAKQVIESWRREYNDSRPHRSLGERTPSEFACQIALNGDLTSSQAVGNSP